MGNFSRSAALSAAIGLALLGATTYGTHAVHAVVPNAERDNVAAAEVVENSFIIIFTEPGVLNYEGGVAGLSRTAPDMAAGKRLDRSTPAARSYEAFLETQRQVHQVAIEATLGRAIEITHSYGISFNGIAARVNAEEAARIATLPGVESVEPDRIYHLDTYRGPSFIGADKVWDGSSTPTGVGHRGEGVKVGIIDSGANSSHPSFANDPSCGFSTATPKLIAVDCSSSSGGLCTGSSPQAAPGNGHGVHTAGTAAGNTIDNSVSPAPAVPDDTIVAGVAPCAQVYSYLVCGSASCQNSWVSAGIQHAIADGVDVINFSISGGTSPWGNNDSDRRFLDAVGNGTFVAASAGNNSSNDPTVVGRVNHLGPWVMTVAASTQDLIIGPGLSLSGPGTPPPATQNVALNPGSITPASSTPTWADMPIRTHANIEGCSDAGGFPAGAFTGSIALVRRGTCPFTEKIANAYNAGAELVIISNNQSGSINMDTTGAPNVPAYSVTQTAGDALIAFINVNASSSTADVEPIVSGDVQGDVLADFSYRGPTPGNLADLTKPDITGPGVDIYAATDASSGHYEFSSGTSMSGPHVAGAGALMRGVHPTWSPMEIRSALMMTAKRDGYREDGTSPWNIDDVGSGRVNVAKAAMAGLTMDETKANFLAANPSGGSINIKQLNLPALRNLSCSNSCTWTRTVRNRLDQAGSWTVGSATDSRFMVSASPASFTLAPDEEQTITFTAWPTATISGSNIAFGYVTLTEADGLAPQQHLTAAIRGSRAATLYTVGGTVSGLNGSGLALGINGGNDFAISADGAYTFPGGLLAGADYAVTVASQPSGQLCTVANGLGAIGAANVTNVDVSCIADSGGWTVTPSVAAGNGTISPDTPQTVDDGDTATFALAPAAGQQIVSVGGTCGGTLTGSSYVTDPVTADCSVIAHFSATPLNYCTRGYSAGVEPISRVTIDGIDNQSPATGGPAYQDFTAIVGQLAPGASYPISVQGNTDGPYTSAVAVYLDWNQNGEFDSGEGYYIGALTGSTGSDGQTATTAIPVPAGALPGQTRMRVVKQYTSSPPGLAAAPACGPGGYGQAEDYTVNIDPGAPVPPSLDLTFTSGSTPVDTPVGLTMTLGNASAGPAALTADFITTLSAGLQLATPANASTTCSGTLTAADGSSSITLATGGAVVAGGCTIEADVVATAPGRYDVATSALSTDQGTAQAAAGQLLVYVTDSDSTSYSTGFEDPFTPGALTGQQDWSARAWQVSTAMPANGDQHIRASSLAGPTTSNQPLAISPMFAVGEAPYVAISANLRLSRNSNGASWRFNPQDPDAGLVTTIVQFDRAAARNIQAIVFGDDGSGTLVNTGAHWPVDTYFDFKVIVDRASGALKLCVDGSQIHADSSGNGTAALDIANVAISQTTGAGQTANNTFDVDDVLVEYQSTDACAEPIGTTWTVTPGVGSGDGIISPDTPQAVDQGDSAIFMLTPDTGFEIDSVGGSCDGTLTGSSYETAPVAFDCTVIANFAPSLGDDPIADITPTSIDLSAAQGASADGPLTIANIGGDSLIYSIAESVSSSAVTLDAMSPLALMSRVTAAGNVQQAAVVPQLNPAPSGVVIDEGFEDLAALLDNGWITANHSAPGGATSGWSQCGGTSIPPAFDGDPNSCALVNYCSTGDATCDSGSGTISNWLLTPEIAFNAGSIGSFHTRTSTGADYADRLEVRLCTTGACTNFGTGAGDVGDFTTVLLTINPNQLDGPDPSGVDGYPDTWTQFTLDGLPSSGSGRIAFRYFVTSGGPAGTRSNIIGIDRVVVDNGTVAPPASCDNPSDIPWLSPSPTSGTVAGGDSDVVTVTADATGLAEGVYTANVCVTTNDPDNALVEVPVSFTVTAPAGGSNGIITSGPLDYALPYSGAGASLNIVSGAFSDTGPISGDWDFNFWASGGNLTLWRISTHAGQFAVDGSGRAMVMQPGDTVGAANTFSTGSSTLSLAPDWLSGVDGYLGVRFNCDGRLANPVAGQCYGYIHLQTGSTGGFPATILDTAFDGDNQTITIVGGQVAEDPAISITPASISADLGADETDTQSLTIANTGGGDLDWTITEADTAARPSVGPAHRVSARTAEPRGFIRNWAQAPLAEAIQDGGFEQGDPNPFWDSGSLNFGTVICNLSCSNSPDNAPRSGSWWAWMGGIDDFEEGFVSQQVTIAPGTGTLSFWLRVPFASGLSADFMSVSVDGTELWRVSADDADAYVAAYQQVTLDVSSFADGAMHEVRFDSTVVGGGTDSSNFMLDDVSLDVADGPPALGCDAPSDLPWLSVSPASGTTAGGASSPVTVTFDSAGLAAGSYSGVLCVASNDPANALVQVPVSMTVADAPGGELTCSGPINHALVDSFGGSYINWETGQISDTGSVPGAHFNPYGSSGLAFFWPGSANGNAGVAAATGTPSWLVLQEGDAVGPESVFSISTGGAVNWAAGADGYLGFRFNCTSAGTCYGYAHMTTTGPTGFPATLVDYCYDPTGAGVTIGTAPDGVVSLAKSFTPTTVGVGQASVATVTLSNTNAVDAVLTTPLVDTLPDGLDIEFASTSCLVTIADSDGSVPVRNASVTLPAGARIPANGSCAINITVQSATPGSYVNTIGAGALQTDQGSNAEAASATLTVTGAVGDPIAVVTPAAGFDFAIDAGSTGSDTLVIGNIGASNLTYSIAEQEALDRNPPSYRTAAGRHASKGNVDGSAVLTSGNALAHGGFSFGDAFLLAEMDISQMADNSPGDQGVSCGQTGVSTADNSWWRRFYFDEHAQVGASADVVSVTISTGSQTVTGGLPTTINLYTLPHATPVDTIPTGSLTLVGTTTTSVSGSLVSVTIPVTGTIADTAGQDLVVEWFTPGSEDGQFFPGANATPETHPTFISAAACGISSPTTAAGIGFPEFHLTMVVTLEDADEPAPPACGNPVDVPWLSTSSDTGTVAPGDSDDVAVTVDASSLAAGDYSAELCLTTNDPLQPLITVPVSLTVESVGPADAIFCSGFESGEDGSCGTPVAPGPFEQPIQDPGFEAGTFSGDSNPYWAGTDSNDPGGTPFYNAVQFDMDAHGGDWIAWFGGWDATSSTQSFSQAVEIAGGGPRFINYWRHIVAEPEGTATVTISVDGTVVDTTDVVAAGLDPGWVNQSVDISSFGDGQVHTIKFEYTQAGTEDGNILIDDVTIDAQAGSARR